MALETTINALAGCGVFAGLNDDQLRLLAFSSESKILHPGDELFHEGEIADGAFILLAGELTIDHGYGRPVVIDEPFATIGELALVAARPRPTTVRASSEAELIFVPREGFKKLIELHPEVAHRMAARIRESITRYLGALEPVRQRMRH